MRRPSRAQPIILVVEDDPLIRGDLVGGLLDNGFFVIEAESAEQAIALLADDKPVDVLLTDINLKGTGTGLDVAEAFRAAPPGIPPGLVIVPGVGLVPPETAVDIAQLRTVADVDRIGLVRLPLISLQ